MAYHVFDIIVAQMFAVLFAMARFPTCRTMIGLLVAPNSLTKLVFHVVESVLLTVRRAILWLPASRAVRGMLLAPSDFAAFVLDINGALRCVILAKAGLTAGRAMSWVFLAPSDFAPLVPDINIARFCVFLAVLSIATRFAKGCPLLTICIEAVGRHLSALICDQGNIPDIFTRLPQKKLICSETKTKGMVKMGVDAVTQVTPSKSADQPKPRVSPLTGLRIQLVKLALMLVPLVALIVLIVQQNRPETHAQLLCQGLEPSKVERQDAYDKYSQLALAVIVGLFSIGDKIHALISLRNHKQQLQAVTSAQQSSQQQQQQLTSGEDWGIGSDAGDREVDVDVTIHKHYSAPIRR